MDTNKNKVGLVLGAMMMGFHALWSVLVLVGWGQSIMNFVFWVHMIHVPYTVGPFDAVAAGTLLVFTGVFGYVMGYVLAIVWNKIHPVV